MQGGRIVTSGAVADHSAQEISHLVQI